MRRPKIPRIRRKLSSDIIDEWAGYRDLGVRAVVEKANQAVAAYTLVGATEPRENQWHDIFDSLDKMKGYSISHGDDSLLSVYPWGHRGSDTEWIPGRFIMTKDPRPSVQA
jgi:hypothetical protein